MTSTVDILTRLDEVRTRVRTSLTAVEGDTAASPVAVAVVREFDAKASKAVQAGNDGARDAVIELEQAADSAKAAAEADPGMGSTARDAVVDAHLAICVLKTEV